MDLTNLLEDKKIISKLIQYKFNYASPNTTLSGISIKQTKIPISSLGRCQLFGEEAFQTDYTAYVHNTYTVCTSLEAKYFRCTLKNFWNVLQGVPSTFEDFCIQLKEKIRRINALIKTISIRIHESPHKSRNLNNQSQ